MPRSKTDEETDEKADESVEETEQANPAEDDSLEEAPHGWIISS